MGHKAVSQPLYPPAILAEGSQGITSLRSLRSVRVYYTIFSNILDIFIISYPYLKVSTVCHECVTVDVIGRKCTTPTLEADIW